LICSDPFVVLAHSRSGSSILTNNIHTHARAICHGEIFHDVEATRWRVGDRYCLLDEDAYRFCEEVAFSAPAPGVTHVGFKVFPYHAQQNEMQRGMWRFLRERRDVRVVHLERWNLFDAFVSHARSERSGIWYLEGETDAASREAHEAVIQVDSGAFFEYARDTIVGMNWAREYLDLDHRPCLKIRYDEMERDLPEVMRRVFEFLDLPPRELAYRFEKLNRASHRSGVLNYEALKEHFAYSFFRDYFSE
jgi:LPS sulfotransferase NodH